jgi:hypothetical protein
MAQRKILSAALALALLAAPAGPAPAQGAPARATDAQIALHRVQQDIDVAAILDEMRRTAPRGVIAFRDVQVVDPLAGAVTPRQTVLVNVTNIAWVGPMADEPKMDGVVVVDGRGRYLSPGLVDAHVHSSAAAGALLNLANGVTTVREMGGFPWLLKVRDHVNDRSLLGPTSYVAGTIINTGAVEGYAVVVRNTVDARRTVRQQAACGYDFVKIHNNLALPVFDAIADQARLEGMDLVGHVPHDMPVRHAAERGMRTMEHLKGFIDDRTLTPGDTDFGAVTGGAEVWNTPTLSTWRQFARGAEAQAWLTAPETRYVSARRRAAWRAQVEAPETDNNRVGRQGGVYAMDIARKLAQAGARFLAGTDADNYTFQVMGFALVDELQLLERIGLSPAAALRAATIEPARAMRVEAEFGLIRPGLRADLVLTDANPLKGTAAFETNRGVMAHGYWLDRPMLDRAMDQLARIQAEPDDRVALDPAAVAAALAQARARIDAGYVFDAMTLNALAAELRQSGQRDAADQFQTLAAVPQDPPCGGAWTPG